MIAIISLNDDKTNRNVLREILADALEEVGLANAIVDGRNDDFVS